MLTAGIPQKHSNMTFEETFAGFEFLIRRKRIKDSQETNKRFAHCESRVQILLALQALN